MGESPRDASRRAGGAGRARRRAERSRSPRRTAGIGFARSGSTSRRCATSGERRIRRLGRRGVAGAICSRPSPDISRRATAARRRWWRAIDRSSSASRSTRRVRRSGCGRDRRHRGRRRGARRARPRGRLLSALLRGRRRHLPNSPYQDGHPPPPGRDAGAAASPNGCRARWDCESSMQDARLDEGVRVLVLGSGKAGHEVNALGVAEALGGALRDAARRAALAVRAARRPRGRSIRATRRAVRASRCPTSSSPAAA